MGLTPDQLERRKEWRHCIKCNRAYLMLPNSGICQSCASRRIRFRSDGLALRSLKVFVGPYLVGSIIQGSWKRGAYKNSWMVIDGHVHVISSTNRAAAIEAALQYFKDKA